MRQIMPNSHILLFECVDQRGITAKITTILHNHDLNIVSIFEHVDVASQRFFMRLEVEGTIEKESLLAECLKSLGQESIIIFPDNLPKKLVVFASKEPYCLADLAVRCLYKELNCQILACISDHPDLKCLAQRFDIPYHYIPVTGLTRQEHEKAVLETLKGYSHEYLVMAKYMRILSSHFVDQYVNKIINIHHSFLPAFIGLNPYPEAHQRGVKLIGATAHFVTVDLDDGPIIAQDTMAVNHATSVSDMQIVGHDIEKKCLARALHLISEDRIFTYNNKTVIFE